MQKWYPVINYESLLNVAHCGQCPHGYMRKAQKSGSDYPEGCIYGCVCQNYVPRFIVILWEMVKSSCCCHGIKKVCNREAEEMKEVNETDFVTKKPSTQRYG
jgi:hypothetical protein